MVFLRSQGPKAPRREIEDEDEGDEDAANLARARAALLANGYGVNKTLSSLGPLDRDIAAAGLWGSTLSRGRRS